LQIFYEMWLLNRSVLFGKKQRHVGHRKQSAPSWKSKGFHKYLCLLFSFLTQRDNQTQNVTKVSSMLDWMSSPYYFLNFFNNTNFSKLVLQNLLRKVKHLFWRIKTIKPFSTKRHHKLQTAIISMHGRGVPPRRSFLVDIYRRTQIVLAFSAMSGLPVPTSWRR
jgi:hypothetical protein